jgi:DNA-binding CsgD family transcriptional regulator/tetratricopeptide (TPR) repeat protein
MHAPPLPGPLRSTPSLPFVGRARELATLRALLPRARGEGRHAALLGGDPGSGKSRLAREFAHEAAGEGALVLYGACDAVVRTPYQAFVDSLDQLTRLVDPATLRDDLGPAGGELARLLPELPLRVGELAAPVSGDPDTERHRLHTAVNDLLTSVAARRPILLVLEDLHWADAPTLALLRHLVRVTDARLLVLATFRDGAADLPGELSDALVDLRRAEGVAQLRLGGLSDQDVAELVARAAGSALGPDARGLAEAIGSLTAGNAFLVCELWRALVETDSVVVGGDGVRLARPLDELATPESVREVASRRLARLYPETTELLELAAVAGADFRLDLLRDAAGLSEAGLHAALDEALRSGMVEELHEPGLIFRFAHELVRRALYDRLSGLRRAELHLRVGEALERAHAQDPIRTLPGLAYHFAAAAPFGERIKAIDYAVRAARAARAALAYDDAASLLRTALELGIGDEGARAEVHLELGDVLYRGGRTVEAIDSFREAAEIARRLGDAPLLARAAIGVDEAGWRPGIAEENAVELLDEAAAALGGEETALRVTLLASLGRALARAGHAADSAAVHAGAVASARRLGEPRALGAILKTAYCQYDAWGVPEVLEMLGEARELGEQLDDVELVSEATAWRVPGFVSLCDLEQAERELAVLFELAAETRQPFMLHVAEHYGSALALCRGRLAEADGRAQRSHEWSRQLVGRDASGVHGIQMFSVRREQGRLPELAPVVRLLARPERGTGPWRPALAVVLAELGMAEEAGRELERVRRDGLDALRESLWVASLIYLADACSAVGDGTLAELVYAELEPLAGRLVMVGHLVACYGAADRYLGTLAATLGEAERADRHFTAARELEHRTGALTWLAHSCHEHGRLLLGRDPETASGLLAEAAALADRLQLSALRARIAAHGAGPAPAGRPALPDGLSAREVDVLRLLATGLSNREIGRELFISEHTAANHVRAILRKTASSNRTEAASYAFRHGLARA